MKPIFIILLLSISGILNSQTFSSDSIVFHQQDAWLFSNQYIFYSDGSFKHYCRTDDLQTWYGKGTYTDKGNTRTLKFGEPDSSYQLPFGLHYESKFVRTLKIKGKKLVSMDYYGTTKEKYVIFEER